MCQIPYPGSNPWERYYAGIQSSIAFNEKTNELYALLLSTEELKLFWYSNESDCWNQIEISPPINYARTAYMDYRDGLQLSTTFDCTRNTMFLSFPDSAYGMAKIHLSRGCNGQIKGRSEILPNIKSRCEDPKQMVIGSELHLIGRHSHYIYDSQSNVAIHNKGNMFFDDIIGDTMAKIEGKVIAFGGSLCEEWRTDYEECMDAVHEYDIQRDQWSSLGVKVDILQGMGCTPVFNGKYIVLIGGDGIWDGELYPARDIQVYSVTDKSVRTSKNHMSLSDDSVLCSVG